MSIKITSLVEVFGSRIKVSEFFGVHRQTIYDWGDSLPELYAYRLKDRRPDIYDDLISGKHDKAA